MRSCGYASYKLTIGSNYKDVFRLNYPICTNPMLNSCASFISEMKSLRLKKLSNRQKLLLEEMLDKDVEERKSQIECVKDYTPLDLMLYYYHENDGCAYLVSLNETNLNNDSLFQGYKYYTFYNEIDLWKFIENLRSKIKPQIDDRPNKRPALLDGRSEIELVFEKDIPMKDVAPIIKKLNGYGYRINFSNEPSI